MRWFRKRGDAVSGDLLVIPSASRRARISMGDTDDSVRRDLDRFDAIQRSMAHLACAQFALDDVVLPETFRRTMETLVEGHV